MKKIKRKNPQDLPIFNKIYKEINECILIIRKYKDLFVKLHAYCKKKNIVQKLDERYLGYLYFLLHEIITGIYNNKDFKPEGQSYIFEYTKLVFLPDTAKLSSLGNDKYFLRRQISLSLSKPIIFNRYQELFIDMKKTVEIMEKEYKKTKDQLISAPPAKNIIQYIKKDSKFIDIDISKYNKFYNDIHQIKNHDKKYENTNIFQNIYYIATIYLNHTQKMYEFLETTYQSFIDDIKLHC